jgi:hypothetical protein
MEIIKGRQRAPFNILLHGEPGVGKSYWASQLPAPLFMGAEEQDELNADKLPQVKSWSEVGPQLDWVLNKDHGYKTLVIDTIDSLESLLHKHILDSDPKKPTAMARAHGGFGAGYNMALNMMAGLRDKLSVIRSQKQMNITIICHTVTKKISDPTALAEYDEHKLTLHDKVESLLSDWVSAVLYMKLNVEKQDGERFAFGDGKKMLMCEKRPGFLAKNRYQLPAQLEVIFDEPAKTFLEGLDRFYQGESRKPEEIFQNILGLLENVQDQELIGKVMQTIEKQTTASALEKTEARLKELING